MQRGPPHNNNPTTPGEDLSNAEEQPQRQRLVEEDGLEDIAWSDGARTTVASQINAVMMAWTFAEVTPRSLGFGCLLIYASLTAAASRNRRSLAAPLQVLIAAGLSVGFRSFQHSHLLWRLFTLMVYATETFLWKGPTSDLVNLAFGKFQRQLFASIVVATLWGMPALYRAAEALETDANGFFIATPPADALGAPAEELERQLAGVLLYGGTLMLVSFSIAAWARIYRVAPDLFRLLVVVAITGTAIGAVLRFLGAEDAPMLAAAATAAFVAMAYCVLRAHDRFTAHLICALAVLLYTALRLLKRPHFALACFVVFVVLKFTFIVHLAALGQRRPRHLPRMDTWPFSAALLFPPSASPGATIV